MKSILRASLSVFALLTLITGLAYPVVVTGIGQAFFKLQTEGSLISKDGVLIGSELIGQNFQGPQYFWGRPSATGPFPYNPEASSGSNLGPLNPALADAVKARFDSFQNEQPTSKVPVELVTASASGLDPEISPAAALFQAERVALARGMDVYQVKALIAEYTLGKQFGVLGEPRINVLKLNLALDTISGSEEE